LISTLIYVLVVFLLTMIQRMRIKFPKKYEINLDELSSSWNYIIISARTNDPASFQDTGLPNFELTYLNNLVKTERW